MEKNNILKCIAIGSVITAFGVFGYVVNASHMVSYLSEDPRVCINCHVMNTQYATWQHSSHRERATCVQCHLPQDSMVDKMIAKARDGFNHSVAMTFRTYEHNQIRISEDASRRIQNSCITCHKELVSQMIESNKSYAMVMGGSLVERRCWDCHRVTAHGSTRSLTTTPNNLGVKELYNLSR